VAGARDRGSRETPTPLKPLGRIVDAQWAGSGPGADGSRARARGDSILQAPPLQLNDLDAWEINEAFAAQVLACLAAWKEDKYCARAGPDGALGELDTEKLNVDGGAIALGHPWVLRAARIVLHLVPRSGAPATPAKGRARMASICIAGPRRRDAGRDSVVVMAGTYRHWKLETDRDQHPRLIARPGGASRTSCPPT